MMIAINAGRMCRLAIAGTILAAAGMAGAETGWEVIHSNVAADVRRIQIPLVETLSDGSGWQGSGMEVQSRAPADAAEGDGYDSVMDLGPSPDGTLYRLLLRRPESIGFLTTEHNELYEGRIQSAGSDGKFSTLREGLVSFGSQIELPVTVSAPSGSQSVTMMVNVNSRSNDRLSGRVTWSSRRSLEGSAMLPDARLKLRILGIASPGADARQVEVSIQPFESGVAAESARVAVGDLATVRECRVALEKVAADGSSAVLAVLSGNIDTRPERELRTGSRMPAFARVDLMARRLVTFEELAAGKRRVLLVFGEFPVSGPQHFYGGISSDRLPIDPEMLMEALGPAASGKCTVAFAVKSVAMSDLYQRWLGKEPPFRILSDAANPLDTTFAVPNSGGWFGGYGGGDRGYLRDQLALPAGSVSLVLVGPKGDVEFVNADAGATLSADLQSVRGILEGSR